MEIELDRVKLMRDVRKYKQKHFDYILKFDDIVNANITNIKNELKQLHHNMPFEMQNDYNVNISCCNPSIISSSINMFSTDTYQASQSSLLNNNVSFNNCSNNNISSTNNMSSNNNMSSRNNVFSNNNLSLNNNNWPNNALLSNNNMSQTFNPNKTTNSNSNKPNVVDHSYKDTALSGNILDTTLGSIDGIKSQNINNIPQTQQKQYCYEDYAEIAHEELSDYQEIPADEKVEVIIKNDKLLQLPGQQEDDHFELPIKLLRPYHTNRKCANCEFIHHWSYIQANKCEQHEDCWQNAMCANDIMLKNKTCLKGYVELHNNKLIQYSSIKMDSDPHNELFDDEIDTKIYKKYIATDTEADTVTTFSTKNNEFTVDSLNDLSAEELRNIIRSNRSNALEGFVVLEKQQDHITMSYDDGIKIVSVIKLYIQQTIPIYSGITQFRNTCTIEFENKVFQTMTKWLLQLYYYNATTPHLEVSKNHASIKFHWPVTYKDFHFHPGVMHKSQVPSLCFDFIERITPDFCQKALLPKQNWEQITVIYYPGTEPTKRTLKTLTGNGIFWEGIKSPKQGIQFHFDTRDAKSGIMGYHFKSMARIHYKEKGYKNWITVIKPPRSAIHMDGRGSKAWKHSPDNAESDGVTVIVRSFSEAFKKKYGNELKKLYQ